MASTSREIARWTFSAAVIVAAHAGIVAAISAWSDPMDAGGAATAILIEMAPIAAESAAEHANLPVAPPQDQQTEPEPTPEVQKEPDQVEPEPEVKQHLAEIRPQEQLPPLPPTPPVTAEVNLPPEAPPEVKKPPPPKKKAAIATAPERAERIAPRQRASQTGSASPNRNVMQSYVNVIRPHIMRHISSARTHGVVTVTFTITKQGKLTARHVSKSSGHPELDNAALATLQRAQPYPLPPPELGHQSTFNFVLPLRYN